MCAPRDRAEIRLSLDSGLVFVPGRQSIMKRDLDLIRDILLSVESWNGSQPLTLRSLTYEGKTTQEIGYQIELLNDFGYIDVRIIKDHVGIGYLDAFIVRMKMAGHEYLDSVRSPEVWNKTKTTLEKAGGGAALDASRILPARSWRI
jgi:hypothetical protein